MIPVETKKVVHVENIGAEFEMSMDEGAYLHLMGILTDLYSDKIAAIVREYSTNALDSHIMAGNSEPILVTLPRDDFLFFTVQDFGLGLSLEDIADIYSKFGASTKRSTNDATGTLGLGCKSGLTYCNHFTLEAVKSGEKSHCVITKTEKGTGTIKVLAHEETDEPDGVKLSFPVNPRDVSNFRRACGDIYSFWDEGTVLVDGEPVTSIFSDMINVGGDIYIGTNSRLSHIVMGSVAYPVPGLPPSHHLSLVAKVPMGAVDFTPSREALEYSDRTQQVVNDLKSNARKQYTAEVKKSFNALTTNYDRWKFAREYSWLRDEEMSEWSERRLIAGPSLNDDLHGYRCTGGDTSYKFEILRQDAFDGDPLVIEDYPYKTISKLHKLKINKYIETNLFNQRWIAFPPGSDLTVIDGYKKKVDWSVVGAVDVGKWRGTAVSGGGAYQYAIKRYHETSYPRRMYASGQLVGDGGKPIVYAYISTESQIDESILRENKVNLALIYKSDEKKFLRDNPTAVKVAKFTTDAKDAVLSSITPEMHLYRAVHEGRNNIEWALKSLHPLMADIEDPDFQSLLRRVHGVRMTSSQQNCIRSLPNPKEIYDFVQSVFDRYPLLSVVGYGYDEHQLNDFVLYMNCKYRKVTT